MSLIPIRKSQSSPERPRAEVPVQMVEEIVDIHEVSIFAEDGPNGKSSFSIFLKFDPESDPSNRQRRSVTISGLTLGVEDKEIPVLARLAGRRLSIFVEKSTTSILQEDLERQIQALQGEVLKLQEKNRALSENFHHLVDQSYKVS